MLETAARHPGGRATPNAAARRRRHQRPARGLGAITFAVIVIAQNLIRGGSAPATARAPRGARPTTPTTAISFVLVATYVLSGLGLAVSSAERCDACSPAPPGLGLHRPGRRHRHHGALLRPGRRPSRRCRSSPTRTSPTSAPSRRCGPCTTASSRCSTLDRCRPARTVARRRRRRHHPRGVRAARSGRLGLLLVGTLAGPSIAAGDAMPLSASPVSGS